jgi:serine/threonine-protein kinase
MITSGATAPDGAPLRVTLSVVAGPHAGQRFTFAEHDTFLVGRSPEAHFILPGDEYFSRHHFLVEVNPPLCRLLDLNSKNGTFVNARKVRSADLCDGDRVKAGHTVFAVNVELPGTDRSGAPSGTDRSGAPSGSDSPETRDPAPSIPTVSAPSAAGATRETKHDPRCPGPRFSEVSGYHMVRELGRGAMGIVYLAETADGSPVALKTVLPAVRTSSEATGRFLREVRILQALNHPNIVALLDAGEADGLLYFAMEYVAGTDASALLKAVGPLTPGRAAGLVCQVLDALGYAHAQGFVHRDIKPGNLLVTRAGNREAVRVADFGLARTYQDSQLSGLTVEGTPGGTPAYMPPEQILRFRDARPPADQYSTAATLYHLLTGEHVHGRCESVHELYMKVLGSDPIPIRSHRPDIPDPLAQAIHRALAREPQSRFPGVGAFREALLPFRDI